MNKLIKYNLTVLSDIYFILINKIYTFFITKDSKFKSLNI